MQSNVMGAIKKMRKSVLPVKLEDRIASSFMMCMIPLYYYFELFVVSPDVYAPNTMSSWFNLVGGHFIASNIIGNYICMIITDTSSRGHQLGAQKSEYSIKDSFSCDQCDEGLYHPPRTWHCVSCGTCILKRDHHCIFIGYCIGQHNRRFFVIFLSYMVIGSVYYFYCTTLFLQKRTEIFIPTLLAQVFCPPLILFFHPVSALHTAYLLLYVVLIITTMMVCTLWIFNASLIAGGIVSIQRKIGRKRLNESTIIENIKEVLGVRWYLTWICPLISSDLPFE